MSQCTENVGWLVKQEFLWENILKKFTWMIENVES
jgi:hypothetical protein